jgi:uncharacterized protein DUF1573
MSERKTIKMTGLILVLLGLAASALAQGGTPDMELNPTSLDFGTMRQQDVRQLTVNISNKGDGILHIQEVKSSCGCTVAEPDVKMLEPGQSTVMIVTFDSEKFMGPQNKFIQIMTNDPISPKTDYQIKAFVSVPLMFTPAYKSVGFGRFTRGSQAKKTIVLESPDVAELIVEPTRIAEHIFRAELLDSPNGDKAIKHLVFHMNPDAPVGHFREVASFKTNIPDKPTFDLDVAGTVVSQISVSPEKINMRYLQRGRKISKTLRVAIAPGYDAKVVNTEVTIIGFKVQSTEYQEESGEYVIQIIGYPLATDSPEAIAAEGRIKGEIIIHLDDKETPVLTVPISYLLRI